MLSLLPFLLVILVLWFFLIRPQTRRQREAREMQSSVNVGEQIMLTSGIFGTVEAVTDDHVLVQVADGVTIKVVRAAIARVIPFEEPAEDSVEATEPGTTSSTLAPESTIDSDDVEGQH